MAAVVQPYPGFGLGLRAEHYQTILDTSPAIDWFEIVSEDYLVAGGASLYYLEKICERYPVVMHGVSMSLGSVDPLNWDYLRRLKHLMQRVNPLWVSDHCCWTGIGQNLHDLLPLPYTDEAVQHMVTRIRQVQDFLERPLVIENVSSYISYAASDRTEWEFLTQICEQADCLLLLDINNVYVSAFNQHFDAIDYLQHIPIERVQQFHLAGHQNCKTHLIDTHNAPVIDEVWQLYRAALQRFGCVATSVEWDTQIPPLETLLSELASARHIFNEVHHQMVVS